VVIHPKSKVGEIKKLIGEIQDKQEKHTPLVKEKIRMNKHKVRKPKECPI
jgi:hypothetical protein